MVDLGLVSPPALIPEKEPPKGSGGLTPAEGQSAVDADFADEGALDADLRGKTIKSGAVTVAAQAAKFVLTTASTVVLARLLTPADFGLMAMVTVVLGFVLACSDMGLSLAVVQRDKITREQVDKLFWITLGLQLVLAFLTCLAAPLLALLYQEPRVTAMTMVMASGFLIVGLGLQHQALLRRRMRFRILAIIEVSAMSVGVAAGLIAASSGLGYWSLVVMYLTPRVLETTGLWMACKWRPRAPRRATSVRSLLRFGGYHTGFQFVNYFARNSDNLLIGWFWGATPLGLYSRAYSLLMLPIVQLNGPVTAVAMPALSRLQHERERFRRAYLLYLEVLTSLSIPVVAVTIILAPEIVELALGDQWTEVVPVFRWLGVAGLVQVVTNTYGTIMITAGRTDRMFRIGVWGTLATLGVFLYGLSYGVARLAMLYAAYTWLSALPIFAYACLGTALRLRDIGQTILRPIGAALLIAASMQAAMLPMGEAAAWLRFGVSGLVAGLVWLALYTTVFRSSNPLRLLRELR